MKAQLHKAEFSNDISEVGRENHDKTINYLSRKDLLIKQVNIF